MKSEKKKKKKKKRESEGEAGGDAAETSVVESAGKVQDFVEGGQPSQLFILGPAHNQFGATDTLILDFGYKDC